METLVMSTPHETGKCDSLCFELPKHLGRGRLSIDSFASGLQIMTLNTRLNEPVVFKSNQHGFPAGIGFCMDGNFESMSSYYDKPVKANSNNSGLFSCLESMDISMTVGRNPLAYSVIMLDAKSLHSLFRDNEEQLEPILESLRKERPCVIPGTVTPAMKMALHQISTCPYTGASRQLYLEGKVLELVAHKLDQLRQASTNRKTIKASSTDIARIRFAAEELTRDLENPPDMTDLARSVGLSRSKIYRLFGQIHGISPFDYLRNHRLQAALHLLHEGKTNVTEVAYMVGYTSLSHFAKAFKELFGVPPSEFLKQPNTISSDLRRYRP